MEPEQYAIMARRERRHWWYAGMRRVALAVLDRALAGQRDLEILDAGCGTGGTTVDLRRFGTVTAVDLAWEAVAPAHGRGLARLAQASIERLPFAANTFDVATSFEVLYHLGVSNDIAALSEIRRVIKPGGRFLLRVPAHDWLRGEHDRLVHTAHRYARDEVEAKLAQAGFAVEWVSWANTVLFPAAAAKRLLEGSSMPFALRHRAQTGRGAEGSPRNRAADPWMAAEPAGSADPWSSTGPPGAANSGSRTEPPGAGRHDASPPPGTHQGEAAEPDLWQPPTLLNALLETTVAVEALVIPRGVRLPFGLSLLALARAT
ncbi:MAG: hypothetical protein NVSMB2_06580 [Chloroflexota bacterium]